jgi:L-lactate dehydrogenase
MDLNHAVPFAHPTQIWAGDYADCAGACVTVIAAGAGQKPGETRLDLVKRNAAIFAQIIPQIARHNPKGILLIATNPVDVLTCAAWKQSGLPAQRVIGSGTVLDTARFRYLLSEHFGVDARSVHAWIIGEHGDSEVPVWSSANVAGIGLEEFSKQTGIAFDAATRLRIFEQTRDAAYRIIERKGATYYAVAAGLMRIVQAILRNQSTVLAVSNRGEDYCGIGDAWLSLPAVINRNGVERMLRIDLDGQEADALRHSADVLKRTLAQIAQPLEGKAGRG